MTIRALRNVSAAVSIAMLLFLGLGLAWATGQLSNAIDLDEAATSIAGTVSELSYLAVDTILHHEMRSQKQWRTRSQRLTKVLSSKSFPPAQEGLLENIRRCQVNLEALYAQLIRYHEAVQGRRIEPVHYRELEQRTTSRLLGQTQEMISDALRLNEATHEQLVAAQRVLGALTLLFVVVISAIVAATWILLTRGVLRPVARLQKGAGIVASGDLDHRIGTARKDEVGELSRAFDAMTERLKASHGSMAAANKELEAFAYSVSHDLRAPLRSLDGFSLVLLEDCAEKLDDEGKDALNRIRGASQRMGTLIDDMLSLSKVTRHEISLEPTDLGAMAEEVLGDLRQHDPGREVETVIAPGMDVETDAHLIRIALANLLGNAWKFTRHRERARIEFGRADSPREATYFVRDNGAGFDMAHSRALFGAFQRMHAARDFEGNGVGLATVQRVIHRLRGRIWAEAHLNQGATFYFTLAPMQGEAT